MNKEEFKLFNRPLLILIVFATLVINYFTMSEYAERFDWEDGEIYIVRKSLNNPVRFLVWILIIPLIVKLSNRFPYSRLNLKNIGRHVLFSIAFTMAIDTVAWLLTDGMLYLVDSEFSTKYFNNYLENFDLYFFNIQYIGLVIYWLILIYISSIDYYRKYKNEALKRTEAESLIAKAELQALKMQVQPHFLFNTLHSISSLIDENTTEAQDVVGRLGDLLRYSLDQGKNDFVSLSTEIEFIENYLEIEKTRFKDRLIVSYEINPECENANIASFILQPIIENAIKHGFAKTTKACHINIKAEKVENQLSLVITDDGKGSETIVKGIGLENTESRLKNYYGSDYDFSYQNIEPHGFRVAMLIPFKQTPEANEAG